MVARAFQIALLVASFAGAVALPQVSLQQRALFSDGCQEEVTIQHIALDCAGKLNKSASLI
jgi:hypothetical protein